MKNKVITYNDVEYYRTDCIRMNGDEKHHEYFIWEFIEMKYLREILERFKDSLIYNKLGL